MAGDVFSNILKDIQQAIAGLGIRVRHLEELPRVSSSSGTTPNPATTVTDETTWGITPAVGTDTTYARAGHTHGTPPAPGIGGHIIQDEGSDLPSEAHLNFIGAGVTATDNAITGATDVTVPGGVGVENKVWLYEVGSTVIVLYPSTPTGLDDALTAAAAGGFSVQLPVGTISGDHTIPANVKLYGVDRDSSILTGQITGANGVSLENFTIVRSANNASELVGVVVPTSGNLNIKSMTIDINQAGSGDAIGVKLASGSCVVIMEECYVTADSGSGDGYAAYREPTETGSIYIYEGRCYGSTTPFNE